MRILAHQIRMHLLILCLPLLVLLLRPRIPAASTVREYASTGFNGGVSYSNTPAGAVGLVAGQAEGAAGGFDRFGTVEEGGEAHCVNEGTGIGIGIYWGATGWAAMVARRWRW